MIRGTILDYRKSLDQLLLTIAEGEEQGTPYATGELLARIGVDTHHHVDELVARGLATRIPHKARSVTLTEDGWAAVRVLRQRIVALVPPPGIPYAYCVTQIHREARRIVFEFA